MGEADVDPLVGEVVDRRYRVEAVLGRGGMGRVYRAQHLGIGRAVAVKVLDPRGGLDRSGRARFEREAVATGRLRHANCVGATDFGALPDGRLYLVMELLDGQTLDDLLAAQTRLPVARAAHILAHILRGLVHAHALGLVHRDLTPRNVVLVPHAGDADFAKVCDFGLARMVGGGDSDRVTQTGVVCGTPKYMSPEQGFGGAIDPRTDLYAASILMFEMLTGRTPFDSDEAMQVLAMHATVDPPSIAEVAPDVEVPGALEALIRRGLEKQPEDRPASAADYLAALERVMARAPAEPTVALTVPAPRETPHRRSKLKALAVIAPMLLAAVLALGLARPSARVAAAGVAAPVATKAPAPAPVTVVEPPRQNPAIAAARKLRFDDAVSRLRTLRHDHPRDAEVARALGDVYGTRNWTNAAMDAYRDAVRLGLRDEALATRVAAMLDSRSQWAAAARLLREIGAPAIGAVTQVAQHDRSPTVRARAQKVLADL